MHDMGGLGHTLQIDLTRDWVNLALAGPGCLEGGGQPVLRGWSLGFRLYRFSLSLCCWEPGLIVLVCCWLEVRSLECG